MVALAKALPDELLQCNFRVFGHDRLVIGWLASEDLSEVLAPVSNGLPLIQQADNFGILQLFLDVLVFEGHLEYHSHLNDFLSLCLKCFLGFFLLRFQLAHSFLHKFDAVILGVRGQIFPRQPHGANLTAGLE